MKGRIEQRRVLSAAPGGFLPFSLVFLIIAVPCFEHFFFSKLQASQPEASITVIVDPKKDSLRADPGLSTENNSTTAAAPPPPTAVDQAISPPDEQELIICNNSHYRTNVCEVAGDARIHGSSFSVFAAGGGGGDGGEYFSEWKIRPYPRKWEPVLMEQIKEYTVRAAVEAPKCSVRHGVPAVVFSTGGLLGKNFFHDLSDVLIPLFLTVKRFQGEVQFFVTQRNQVWFSKYGPVLRFLTNYEPIYGDEDDRVHCFPSATVGLWSHSELSIFPTEYPANGTSMTDFRRILRRAYGLKREFSRRVQPGDRPRLLFLSRRQSRSLLNERAVLAMARRLGFKVVVAPPETVKNMVKFAKTVNSCDLLMGVHGAGLTNMVFLPTNATMVQVVPWGEMKYACRYSYGDPALGMGMKYREYEVGMEETSLKDRYPKDHPVFKDPLSIHRQGYAVAWNIFITQQNVTLDLKRFRPFLKETLDSFQ